MNLLDVVYAQLSITTVREGCLQERCRTRTRVIRGLATGNGTIFVNPIPDILDTLIHELLHERFPHWGEAYVKAQTTKLIRSLSPTDMDGLYQEYLKCRSPLKNKKTVT